MEKEFVTYQQALKLKELGFDEPCLLNVWWLNGTCTLTKKLFEPLIYINGNDIDFEYNLPKEHPFAKGKVIDIGIPIFSQAFRWFRDKYGVHSSPRKYDETKWWVEWGTWTSPVFEAFEEAESAWLNKLLEIVESKSE